MKQIDLMAYLKNDKAKEYDIYKINSKPNNNENIQKLTNVKKRMLCDNYLIPMLCEYFIEKKSPISDILFVIGNDEKIINEIKQSEDISNDFEKRKNFLYQTCLNFIEEYSDFILTSKLSEQTKKELILNAFTSSDLIRKLLNVNRVYEDAENGCYVSIDLHEISK